MNETCENAEKFLSGLVTDLRFDLRVSAEWTDEEKPFLLLRLLERLLVEDETLRRVS